MPDYELIPVSEPEYALEPIAAVPAEPSSLWPQKTLDKFNQGKKTTQTIPKEASLGDAISGIGSGMATDAKHSGVPGVVEGGLNAATGMVSWIPSGIVKSAGLVSGQLEGGIELGDYLQEKLTYEPKTETGKKIAGYVAKPFEWLSEKSKFAADYYFDKLKNAPPELRALVASGALTAGESIPFIGPAAIHVGLKGVKGTVAKMGRDLSVLEKPAIPLEQEFRTRFAAKIIDQIQKEQALPEPQRVVSGLTLKDMKGIENDLFREWKKKSQNESYANEYINDPDGFFGIKQLEDEAFKRFAKKAERTTYTETKEYKLEEIKPVIETKDYTLEPVNRTAPERTISPLAPETPLETSSSVPLADAQKTPGQVIMAAELNPGDKFNIKGEEFKVKGLEEGKVVIEDGVTMKVAPDADITVENLKPAPKVEAPPEAVRQQFNEAAEAAGGTLDGEYPGTGAWSVTDGVTKSSFMVKSPEEIAVKFAEARAKAPNKLAIEAEPTESTVAKPTSSDAPTRDISAQEGLGQAERTAKEVEAKINEVADEKVVKVTKPKVEETKIKEEKRLDKLDEVETEHTLESTSPILYDENFFDLENKTTKDSAKKAIDVLKKMKSLVPEFEKAPVFTVVEGTLEFKDNYTFNLLPEALGINKELIKNGEKIRVDLDDIINTKKKDIFYIREGNGWKKKTGEKIKIEGYEDLDFFISKNRFNRSSVTEGTSGLKVGDFSNPKEELKGFLDRAKEDGQDIHELIKTKSEGKVSPSYLSKAEQKKILKENKLAKLKKSLEEEFPEEVVPVEKKGVTLTSGVDPTQLPEAARNIGRSIKEEWDKLESTSPVAKGLKENLRKTGRGLREAFDEPEYLLKSDPTGKGKEIFKTLASAEEAKNAFLEPRLNEFIRQTKGIKPRSVASEQVGKALDGKIKPDVLKPDELKAYNHLKNEYDFLIKEYARRAAGSEESYQKVLKKSLNKEAAKVRVEDLDSNMKNHYNQLSAESAKIRAGHKLDELTGEAKKDYWVKRQQMSDVLHNEWLKTLTEGEAEAYNILSRKIKDYLPHLLDKAELADMFRIEIADINNKLRTATNESAISGYKTRLKDLEIALTKTQGGFFVTYDQLPRNIKFRFFETRKGKQGYSYDAMKAYQAYLHGIAKKMFDEQAVRKVKDLYNDMSPDLKPATKDLVRNYMGWNKNPLDWLAGTISSFEWIRTLGLNPRSAIVNLTQRINTAVYAGEKWAAKAEKMMLLDRDKANAIFEKSGIAREVPQVLTEGEMPVGMEKIRSVVGYMFHKVELGNRKHAYLSGYLKALENGASEVIAMKQGIKTVHKTQFRYGKLGMPKVLRHPVGRVALQFTSYPLKQSRFLWELAKKDPVALIKYIAYAEGINWTIQEFLDADLSNALGFGITWGEVLDSVRDFAGGDMRGAFRHGKQAFQRGGGLLPSGLGPAVSGVSNIYQKSKEGKGFSEFLKEVKPVMYIRISQAYNAVKNEKGGMYPVKDANGHIMYRVTSKQLLQRTIGPRTATESKSYKDYEAKKNLEEERVEILHDITNAILDGHKERTKMLVKKYHIFPSDTMLNNELINRNETKSEQSKMGIREEYQLQREGRRY